MEESSLVREQGDLQFALKKVKEAGKRERALCRMREQQNLLDQLNVDLTYAVTPKQILFLKSTRYRSFLLRDIVDIFAAF